MMNKRAFAVYRKLLICKNRRVARILRICHILLTTTMQAIILAGGYGTRLHPLTINAPKPMIPVVGKPMIEYLIEKIDSVKDVSEIFIVSNEKFSHVFEEWLEKKPHPKITIINDGTISNETRLGPVGDLVFLMDKCNIHEDVLILGGDNLFEDGL